MKRRSSAGKSRAARRLTVNTPTTRSLTSSGKATHAPFESSACIAGSRENRAIHSSRFRRKTGSPFCIASRAGVGFSTDHRDHASRVSSLKPTLPSRMNSRPSSLSSTTPPSAAPKASTR